MTPTKLAKRQIFKAVRPVHLCFVAVVSVGGKYENTRAGCTSRKQIIDSREGEKGSGLAGNLSECACFNPFTANLMSITLKQLSRVIDFEICFPYWFVAISGQW